MKGKKQQGSTGGLQTRVGCFAQLVPLKEAATGALHYRILVGHPLQLAQWTPPCAAIKVQVGQINALYFIASSRPELTYMRTIQFASDPWRSCMIITASHYTKLSFNAAFLYLSPFAAHLTVYDCSSELITTLQTPLTAHPDTSFAQPPKPAQDLFDVRALLTAQGQFYLRLVPFLAGRRAGHELIAVINGTRAL